MVTCTDETPRSLWACVCMASAPILLGGLLQMAMVMTMMISVATAIQFLAASRGDTIQSGLALTSACGNYIREQSPGQSQEDTSWPAMLRLQATT